MEKIFNKLVRDKIPDKIEKNGEYALTETLNDNDFENALDNKLLEEVKEVIASRTPDEIKEELADLLEVMLKKAEINNISFNDIEDARKQKKDVKGGFDTKIFLIKTADQSYVDENRGCLTCVNGTCRVPYKEKLIEEDGMPAGHKCFGYVSCYKKRKKQ